MFYTKPSTRLFSRKGKFNMLNLFQNLQKVKLCTTIKYFT